MEETLFSLALLLALAKIAEGVAVRFKQNGLAAFILSGIVLGPALGIVEPTAETELVFGIGVLFLFFLIGVDEIDISGFAATLRGRFFTAAAVGFAIPMAASLGVTLYVLDMEANAAIALAGVLSLSSLGVVAKVLSDMGHLKEPLGLEIFTTVLVVELVGLLIVGFTLNGGEEAEAFNAESLATLVFQIAGFGAISWVLASRVFPPLIIRLRRLLGAPHLAFGLLVGIIFLTSVGADTIGIHGSLGVLLLGTAMSGLPHRLRSEVMPGIRSMARGLFVPLFFASAGLHLDLSFTDLPASTIAAVVAVAIFGKFAGSFIGVYVARLTSPFAIASGLMSKGVVEIALLLVMLETGIIGSELFSLLTIIMLAYIFVVPPIMSIAINRTKAVAEPVVPGSVPPSYVRFALDDTRVENILEVGQRFPQADVSITAFTDQWMVPEQKDYVVVKNGGTVAGILSLNQIQKVSKDRWETTEIGTLVRDRHPNALPDEPLDDVLERMADHWLTVLPVISEEDGTLVGAVTTREILSSMVDDTESGVH